MANKIKSIFDGIQAEENLKADTLLFLRERIQKRNKPRAGMLFGKLAATCVSLIVIVVGVFFRNFYFTESAYVDLDVNPSVELTINRFDRVIGEYAYNDGGLDVLEGITVKHRDYKEAVGIIIDTAAEKGFAADAELVSVTVQTNDKEKESEMLLNIEKTVISHHAAARVNAFLVDGGTRTAAHNANLSPAKYLAILDLQQVDPTATIETCRGHTITEIIRLTEEHSGSHHNAGIDAENENDESADSEYQDVTGANDGRGGAGGGANMHHGGNRRHGGGHGHR